MTPSELRELADEMERDAVGHCLEEAYQRVPEGCSASAVWTPTKASSAAVGLPNGEDGVTLIGHGRHASCPGSALYAAALRARAYLMEGGDGAMGQGGKA